MQALIVYAILSAGLFYLGSRAVITQFLWSRYPRKLAEFADCSACSGFWYGAALAATIGRIYGLDVGPFDADRIETPFIVGAMTMVLTPMVAGLMQHAINVVGSAIDYEEPPKS